MVVDPSVAVILLNWNSYEETKECIVSLADCDYENLKVCVVDNGSEDGSGEALEEEFPEKTFVFNDENLGFAGGVNSGIERVQDDELDYILLFNTDVAFPPDFLRSMVETAGRVDKAGVVGAKILKDETETIDDAGRMIKRSRGRQYPPESGLHRDEVTGANERDVVSGACMLLDCLLVSEIGLLDDEHFFFGAEDVDYCIRASEAGWKVIVDADTHISHYRGGVSGSFKPFRRYNTIRNRLYLIKKHEIFSRRAYAWTLYRALLAIGDYSLDGEFDSVFAVMWAQFDFLQNRTSPRYTPEIDPDQ